MDTSGVEDCCAGCPKGLLLVTWPGCADCVVAANGFGLLFAPPIAPKGLADAAVPPVENGLGFAPSCEGCPKPPADGPGWEG